uniref:Uncharacterized protein n=1 Tax=Arundo donax TaxID=35708 RepID=A0A0A9AVE8_ARUDO
MDQASNTIWNILYN